MILGGEFVVYNLADFRVEFNPKNSDVEKFFDSFKCLSNPEIVFEISDNDIEFEKYIDKNNSTKTDLIFTAMHRKFAEWLPLNDAFVLHSSLIDVRGVGIAFTALSGTGKTTHTLLWQKLLGDKMQIINGDKPIIRFFSDELPYGFSTPWKGKEGLGNNGKTILKHICFIERSVSNSCEKLEPSQVLDLILNQVYMPKNQLAVLNTMKLVDRLLNKCTFWKIRCNTDISAAEVAYNTILGEE